MLFGYEASWQYQQNCVAHHTTLRPPSARWGLGVALNKYFSKLGNYFHSHLTFYLFIEKPTANAHIQKQFSAPIGINIPCQIVGVVMDLREEAQ